MFENNWNEVIEAGMADPDIEGPYINADGQRMLDRRLTAEAIARLGLNPRTADLNLIGPDQIAIPNAYKVADKAENSEVKATRAGVKSALLARGLPGVNL